MKQTKYRFPLPVVALMVAVSLVGCAKEEPNPNNPDRMTIAPLASLGTSGVEAGSSYGSSAQTKAPVSGSDVLDLYVVRADQTSASAYGSYEATAITAARAAGTGSQTLTLNPVQYYRADGLKTKLTGWYPGGGTAVGDITGKGYYNGTTHTVSWTINGQQDIMTAPKQEGSWTSAMPTMTFDHRLTQLQFYPYAETQATVDAWGKIIRIEVLNQQNTVAYTLTDDATGAVSFSGAATNSFSAGIAAWGASLSLSATADKVANVKQMGNPVMIVPQSAANHTLTLRIILADNTYKNVTLTGALTAGTPYRLYMKFTERDITIETTVAQWNDVTTSDNMGNVRIGDYLDGGIVYEITDATNYKVFSLEQGTNLQWSNVMLFVGGAAASTSDGIGALTSMKEYATANSLDFSTTFPAANFCHQMGPGWYLPSIDELIALYKSYHNVNNTAAINASLTAAGGTPFPTSGFLRATTEYSGKQSFAYSFAVPTLGGKFHDKTNIVSNIRCLRSVPPAVGNYYYSDGSYSTALEAGKTATGVIYYVDAADPTKFKVVSLDEASSLRWAKSDTYVVNGARSDVDGRTNSNAIKAAFDAKTAGVAITESTFDAAFPAAAECYNYTGKDGTDPKGTWYLPAKSEVQYLWCAYNGVAPTSWVSTGTNAAAPAVPNAQADFNKYLTAAGGGVIVSDSYWSSTELSFGSSAAWYVLFSDGYTSYLGKTGTNRVRCVRDI